MKTLRYSFGLLAAVLGLAGCSGKYGGGAMPSASGVASEKATYGFTVHAANDGNDCNTITSVKGELQFVDHGTGVDVAFHAKIWGFRGFPEFYFLGDYYVKGKKQGAVQIRAHDFGPDNKTDNFFVEVLDGSFAGYINSGTFEKGNLTYRPDPLCQ